MQTTRTRILAACAAPALLALAGWALAQEPGDALEQGFRNPPDSAKPRTWWHWTSGNITKEGITKDLEWMKRVGIGGFQLADVASGSGQTVEKKLIFGSPEWLDAVRHAAAEADRLGLEMAIFSSAGWSETGGPWVKPEQAMKKLVWSETEMEGPLHFSGKLPQPPASNGPIRNLSSGGGRGGAAPDPTWYGDAAVIAYRTPAGEIRMADLHPKVTANAGPIDGAALLDDDLNTAISVPAPPGGGAAFVQFEFAQPFSARAVTIAGRSGIPFGRILASDDGVNFRTLISMPGQQLYRGGTVRTYAFPQTAARYYRAEFTAAPLAPATEMSQAPTQPAAQYALSELTLHSGARVHRAEEKAGFSFFYRYDAAATPPVASAAAIDRSAEVDLTARMTPDGALQWDARRASGPSCAWAIP